MTSVETIKTSGTTTNSLYQLDYTNLDDHISQTSIDTPKVQAIYFMSSFLETFEKTSKQQTILSQNWLGNE